MINDVWSFLLFLDEVIGLNLNAAEDNERLVCVCLCLIDNLKDLIHSNRRLLQIVLNTAYGVDTFFVLR